MSSANKKHMQGGMNTTYSNVNTEDERNKKAEELLFQAWETAGYHGQPDEDYYPRIIRKSKFPQNPKRSVRFSGKGTKRSVQKRKARNTQKAETKVL